MFRGFMALFASIGFGILFNAPKKIIPFIGTVGMLGGVTYKILSLYGISEVLSLFIASLLISFLSEILARKLHCPSTIFLICALVPLVPGGGMYYTMLEVVQNNINEALRLGINTLVQACSIVMACTLVSSIFYTVNNRHTGRK